MRPSWVGLSHKGAKAPSRERHATSLPLAVYRLPVATPALAILRASRRLRHREPSVYETEGLLCGTPTGRERSIFARIRPIASATKIRCTMWKMYELTAIESLVVKGHLAVFKGACHSLRYIAMPCLFPPLPGGNGIVEGTANMRAVWIVHAGHSVRPWRGGVIP